MSYIFYFEGGEDRHIRVNIGDIAVWLLEDIYLTLIRIVRSLLDFW